MLIHKIKSCKSTAFLLFYGIIMKRNIESDTMIYTFSLY